MAHIRIGYTVYVQICKDLQNLQLQTIQFYEYVYYAATNFGPKIAPSSGHNNTRKGIHIETETIKPEIARCTLKKKNIYIYSMPGKNSTKTQKPRRRVRNNDFGTE